MDTSYIFFLFPSDLSLRRLLQQSNRPHVRLGYERVLNRVHPVVVLERGGVPAARQQGLDESVRRRVPPDGIVVLEEPARRVACEVQRRAAVDVLAPTCARVRGDEEADGVLARPASHGDVKGGPPESILLGERARRGPHHLLQQLERRVVVDAAVNECHAIELVDLRYSIRRGAKGPCRAHGELLERIPVLVLDIVEDQFYVRFDTVRCPVSSLVRVLSFLASAAMTARHGPSMAVIACARHHLCWGGFCSMASVSSAKIVDEKAEPRCMGWVRIETEGERKANQIMKLAPPFIIIHGWLWISPEVRLAEFQEHDLGLSSAEPPAACADDAEQVSLSLCFLPT